MSYLYTLKIVRRFNEVLKIYEEQFLIYEGDEIQELLITLKPATTLADVIDSDCHVLMNGTDIDEIYHPDLDIDELTDWLNS